MPLRPITAHAFHCARDEDVLDTWFSSALWPFSTLGWPEDTPEVKRYYKTDVVVTGFDIIFFWIAPHDDGWPALHERRGWQA